MTDYYVVIIENKHDNTSRSVLKNFLRKRTKVDMGITQISAEGKTAKEILTTLFRIVQANPHQFIGGIQP